MVNCPIPRNTNTSVQISQKPNTTIVARAHGTAANRAKPTDMMATCQKVNTLTAANRKWLLFFTSNSLIASARSGRKCP